MLLPRYSISRVFPSVYAGSEFGIEGTKVGGDDRPLRPRLPSPSAAELRGKHPDLAEAVTRFATVRRHSPALRRGTYRPLHVASEQFAFERAVDGERVIVNAASTAVRLGIPFGVDERSAFADALEFERVFEVRSGRLHVDVPSCRGRILVTR